MGVFDALIGAGSSALSQIMSYAYQKKLMKYEYDLARKSRQTSFGDTRQSLESAGYNPMLATGVQSNSITPSASAPAAPDPASMVSALASSKAQKDTAKRNEVLNEVDRQRAGNEARVNMQQEALLRSQTDSQELQNDVNRITLLDKAQEELEGMRAHSARERQEINESKQRIKESKSNITKNMSTVGMINSATSGQNLSNEYMRYKNEEERGYQSYRKQYPNAVNTGYALRATGFKGSDVVQSTVGAALLAK